MLVWMVVINVPNPQIKKAACFNEIQAWDVNCVTIIMRLSCEGAIDPEQTQNFYHSLIKWTHPVFPACDPDTSSRPTLTCCHN